MKVTMPETAPTISPAAGPIKIPARTIGTKVNAIVTGPIFTEAKNNCITITIAANNAICTSFSVLCRFVCELIFNLHYFQSLSSLNMKNGKARPFIYNKP